MRKKMGNGGFIILYPGLHPKSTLDDYERRDQPAIYITRSGEFVSINGRRYLGCDLEAKYVEVAQKRLAKPFDTPMFAA